MALTDEDILDFMSKMDEAEEKMVNRRLAMVSYHKYNPIYLYKKWRGGRRAKRFNEVIRESFRPKKT